MSILSIRRPGMPPPVSETAAGWVLRQEAGALTERDEERFAAWLAEDPAHVAAYEDAIWALDATARHAGDPRVREIREAALSARGDRPQRRGLWAIGGGAIAASLAALWFLAAQPSPLTPVPAGEVAATVDPNRANYRTAVGERLAITLPDNSVATLDTNSELRVAYTAGERSIHLLRGQAIFEVAHGRAAPFRVRAAGQEIVALGTTFNVRLEPGRVSVALVEGVVKVRPEARSGGAFSREVTMRAGERLEAGPDGLTLVRPADMNQVAAWRNGELVFNDTRLADAVAEFNRYTSRTIMIEDPAVGAYRISGVFRTSDPERFSRALSEVLPVETAPGANGAPILRARRN
jgi:transmembrane sensor